MTQRSRDEKIVFAFRNVDDLDLRHLELFLPDSGHGQFWKSVVRELRAAIAVDGELSKGENG